MEDMVDTEAMGVMVVDTVADMEVMVDTEAMVADTEVMVVVVMVADTEVMVDMVDTEDMVTIFHTLF
jgi:hypothetical protein